MQSLEGKQEHDRFGIPEVLNSLGTLYAAQQKWPVALDHYQRSLESSKYGRHHYESEALVGICLAKYHLGAYADISPLAAQEEQLAQQYEYNDHLASLRLTQGYVAWESLLEDWGTGFDAALAQYQQALVYALRYNRFFLNEVLRGGGICTLLRPIIPHCRARGDEGRQMLTALRDWWQTGVNDVGTPRPDTISPIPERIPLLEAERMAREREPRDGSPQKRVIEKLEEAVATALSSSTSNH